MIEIGGYVRTTKGYIYKIENKQDIDMLQFQDAIIGEIKIHSKHLSDLVECNDIVNGHKVVHVTEFPNYEKEIYTYIRIDSTGCYGTIPNIDVKEILTHELYEKNCYKLKEDKN